uniref:Rhoptry kinase family protein ROP43 (Incomplete catalytic triad) n=1 Tax=Toxoplasma gondii (strain ATCC 50861 / VEG) TaxID=432359 RepID=A0A0F7UUL8_TOXGV|nr:TPA: Rhoptry kinase family protein ROP43 (incomplete catalytic triad) [Toxoplasma gondii VEG]
MRTSVALFFAALGSISLPCTLHVSLATPMQGTLGPDVPENIGEPPVLPSSSSDVPLRGAEGGSTQEGAVEGPLPQEWKQPPPKPPRRRLVESMRSNSSSSIGRGGESIVTGPENVANDGGGSPSDDLKIVQPEDVPPGGPGPKAPGVGTRMRNWATRSPRQQAQRARDMFGRMGRFVGGARRAVGRGWRRFTTGMAGVTDRVRGRLALRSSFEFRNEEAVGQSELASLASSMTVTAPEGEALEVAREAGLRSGASINLVSATTGEQVTVSLRAPLGIGEYTAVFSGFISGIDSELAVKAFLGKTTESMSVAETEASILKIVSLKDPVDAMSRLRLLAPIETLVYRRDSDSADQSEGRPVVLVPKASSSLVDVINFLRSGDASAFDDRAKKIVRLGATVQLIQLLAALHTRKVVHGKLEPKSVLLFSHGLLYLSDLGRARRHGERFTTSRPSRYGAPEVLEHPETPYTYSRDAYSLGIILFELWCGRLPFDLGTPGVDSSEKLENSHPVILYQTVRNLDQRLSFDVCPSDMPESVKTLIRKFLTRRRWTRLVPQAALRDANFRRTMQLLQETVQGNGETQV